MRTKERDQQNITALSKLGWHTLIIWECEAKNTSQLRQVLIGLLPPDLENI